MIHQVTGDSINLTFLFGIIGIIGIKVDGISLAGEKLCFLVVHSVMGFLRGVGDSPNLP